MYELVILNLMLEDRKFISLDPKYFLNYRKEFNFIRNHYEKFGNIPDKVVFAEAFPSFEFVEVKDSLDFILYQIREAYAYSKLSKIITENAQFISNEDSILGAQKIRQEISEVLREIQVYKKDDVDIIKNAKNREQLYRERVENRAENGGILGISTGVKELDNILHGWLNEDLVVIFARTNEGKSWLVLFFAMMAWSQGKKVLFYSGEMSRDVVGYRFDTLYKHFSNTALMQGKDDLGEEKGISSYSDYVNKLSESEGFYVVTPRDIGGKPTVRKIEELYEEYQADLICIDQLTLMEDIRRGESQRIKYNNISEDLFGLSERIQKPILAVTQAKRQNDKKKDDKDLPPELDDIYESDGIAQNSTRVLSMKVVGRVLKLAIQKNRYGEKNKNVFLVWDKDLGYIEPLLNDEESLEDMEKDFGF